MTSIDLTLPVSYYGQLKQLLINPLIGFQWKITQQCIHATALNLATAETAMHNATILS